jgi:hypothetical protein
MTAEMIDYGPLDEVLNIARGQSSDAYQSLMAKEKDVLEVVNRVVAYDSAKAATQDQFVNMSVLEIVHGFGQAWLDIVKDLQYANDGRAALECFTKGSRGIYVGITLVLLALLLFFAHVSS